MIHKLILISGPVGVGKTTTASALSDAFNAQSRPHCLVDLDGLRYTYPRPKDDRFGMRLGLKNLGAVWANAKDAGATTLIVASVIETRAEADQMAQALAIDAWFVVQLMADVPTLMTRVRGRESGESLLWHEARAKELAEQMSGNTWPDLQLDTSREAPEKVAAKIITHLASHHHDTDEIND